MNSKSFIHTHAHLHTYTAQQTSRCPLLPVKLFHSCGKRLPLTFSHRVSYPRPHGHWHLSPPILTHSFLLAMLCRTPAITTMLPTRLHGSMIGRCWDGCPFQPMADQSPGCHVPTLQWFGWPAEDGVGKKGWMRPNRHTQTHTHSNGSFSNTKRMGSLLRLSVLLWCIIYVAIVWPSL